VVHVSSPTTSLFVGPCTLPPLFVFPPMYACIALARLFAPPPPPSPLVLAVRSYVVVRCGCCGRRLNARVLSLCVDDQWGRERVGGGKKKGGGVPSSAQGKSVGGGLYPLQLPPSLSYLQGVPLPLSSEKNTFPLHFYSHDPRRSVRNCDMHGGSLPSYYVALTVSWIKPTNQSPQQVKSRLALMSCSVCPPFCTSTDRLYVFYIFKIKDQPLHAALLPLPRLAHPRISVHTRSSIASFGGLFPHIQAFFEDELNTSISGTRTVLPFHN